jgi:hypothetical protein
MLITTPAMLSIEEAPILIIALVILSIEEIRMLITTQAILQTEEIRMLITAPTVLLLEEIAVLTQTILHTIVTEPAEKTAITTLILIPLQYQEIIVTLLLAPILLVRQARQVLQAEVCVLLEAKAEDHDLLVVVEEAEEDNSFLF